MPKRRGSRPRAAAAALLALIALPGCMLGVEEAEMSRVAPYIPPPSPDSTGGVLIVHRPPALQFTTNWPIPDWCAEYAAHHAITSASQQVNRIDAEDQGVNAGPKVRRGPVQ